MKNLFVCSVAVMVLLVAGQAVAQDIGANPWPALPGSMKMLLVTVAEPRRAQKCTVQSTTDTEILCARHFWQKPTNFARSDVQAVILPGHRSEDLEADLVAIGLVSAAITGAVFLWPVTVVGSLAVGFFGSLGLAGPFLVADRGAALPDRVIYLARGATLQVPLRWQKH